MTQLVIPIMREQGDGLILYVSTGAVNTSCPDYLAGQCANDYSAADGVAIENERGAAAPLPPAPPVAPTPSPPPGQPQAGYPTATVPTATMRLSHAPNA